MATSKAMNALEHEHRVIQKVAGGMAVLAERLEKKAAVDADTLRGLVKFLRVFGEQCHHAKEEMYLFPLLQNRGVPPTGCPLHVLDEEHRRDRHLVARLGGATEAYIRSRGRRRRLLIRTLRSLADFYPGHIWKEDYLLFPMANKILSDADQEKLHQEFERVETRIGHRVHHALEEFAERVGTLPCAV